MPGLTPETIPVAVPTETMAALLLDQTPPGVASEQVAADPTQTDGGPEMDGGSAFTVTGCATEQPDTE